eukprot:Gb_38520 [translate_table: standard]
MGDFDGIEPPLPRLLKLDSSLALSKAKVDSQAVVNDNKGSGYLGYGKHSYPLLMASKMILTQLFLQRILKGLRSAQVLHLDLISNSRRDAPSTPLYCSCPRRDHRPTGTVKKEPPILQAQIWKRHRQAWSCPLHHQCQFDMLLL